jgi:hypothetical protein
MTAGNGLAEIFKKLCSELNRFKISYCVAGGFAVSLWGAPRGTEDIDLVIMLAETEKAKITDFLSSHFLLVQSHPENMVFGDIIIWRHIVKSASGDNLYPLDMILARNDFLLRSLERKIELIYQGITIPVISIEDLLILKTISNRDIDNFDKENLVKSGIPIDWNYLKDQLKKLNLDHSFFDHLA